MTIRIRGFAVPYNLMVDGPEGEECFARGAFTDLFRSAHLQSFDHSDDAVPLAKTTNGTLDLFDFPFGLGFEATLKENRAGFGIARAMVNGCDQCSVSFSADYESRIIKVGTLPTVEHVKCRLKHISICAGAVYNDTGVWRADISLTQAPARIKKLAALWERDRHRAKALRPPPRVRQQYKEVLVAEARGKAGPTMEIAVDVDHYQRFLASHLRSGHGAICGLPSAYLETVKALTKAG